MVCGKLLEKAGVSCSLSTHTFTFHTLTLSLAMLATLALGHRPHLECSHSTASCSADAVALELLGAFESLLAPAPRWPELRRHGNASSLALGPADFLRALELLAPVEANASSAARRRRVRGGGRVPLWQ